MPRVFRALALLLLAGIFLAASFIGGMVHSVFTDLMRGVHAAWWWAAGVIVLLALLGWRWRHRTHTAPPPGNSAPRT